MPSAIVNLSFEHFKVSTLRRQVDVHSYKKSLNDDKLQYDVTEPEIIEFAIKRVIKQILRYGHL
jgi:hypothetical protein